MKLRLILVLPLVISFVACSSGGDFVPAKKWQDKLQYTGFSVKKPKNEGWYLIKRQRESGSGTFGYMSGNDQQAIIVAVNIASISTKPKSIEEMTSKFKKDAIYTRDPANKVISYEQAPVNKQGQMCIQHKLKFEKKDGQAVAAKFASGFTCVHPSLENAVIDVMFTVDGNASNELTKEGDDFLNGISIEVAPGKAAS